VSIRAINDMENFSLKLFSYWLFKIKLCPP